MARLVNIDEDNIGLPMTSSESVNRNKLILRLCGIGAMISSLMFTELFVTESIAESSPGLVGVHLRGSLNQLIHCITLFIIDWTLLEKVKFVVGRYNNTNILKYLKRCKLTRIGIMFTNGAFYCFFHVISVIARAKQVNKEQTLMLVAMKITPRIIISATLPMTFFANIYMFYLLDQGVTLLTVDYMYLNYHLNRLRKMKGENLEYLISLRKLSCQMIRNTKNFEKFARYETGRLYILAFTNYVFNIYDIIRNDGKFDKLHVLWFIVDCLTITVFTYKAIRLNAIFHEESEILYELSLPIRSDEYRDEVIIFYQRLIRKDVGFTFFGIFTLTSNFVISLVTIAITIMMAVPGYIPIIKNMNHSY